MTALAAGRFSLDSGLDLAADSYTAELASSATFLAKDDADTITLEAGLKDPITGTVHQVDHLVGGVARYGLTITPEGITGSVAGRDRVEELRRQKLAVQYRRGMPTDAEAEALADAGVVYQVGTFRASEIARQVVEACGLTLAWECRDYTLLQDFEAVGRPLDILRKLVEPWSQVEPLKVDLFIQAETVFCRPRSLTPTPDYTYNIYIAKTGISALANGGVVATVGDTSDFVAHQWLKLINADNTASQANQVQSIDSSSQITLTTPANVSYDGGLMKGFDPRIKQIDLTCERAKRYGTVRLSGAPIATGLVEGTTASELEESSTSETKDEAGTVTQRVVRTTTYRMPDRLVLRTREQTYDNQGGVFKLVKEQTQENEWEGSRYDDRGARNQPRQLSQVTNVFGNTLAGKAIPYQQIGKQYVGYAYDTEEYQSLTSTRKWELKKQATSYVLSEIERVTRTLAEVSHLETEEVTSVFKVGKAGEFFLAQQDTNKSAGVRPAGPRPGRTLGGSWAIPIELTETIETHPWAEDVQYSNPHLTAEDLAYIVAQFRAASGLWAYELRLPCVAMPWLRKADVLALTGLLSESGAAIPLGPALIVQQGLTYDEISSTPSMLSTLRAQYWSAT